MDALTAFGFGSVGLTEADFLTPAQVICYVLKERRSK